MTSAWRDTTIGDEVTLQRGFDITRAQQRPGQVPVVSSSGISSFHDTSMVEGPGVVLGRKGVVGSVHFVAANYWPHDTTLWVKDFKGNLPRFVYYFFRGMVDRIADMDVGSANPTLNRNHVHPIHVRWPELPEQRAITAVLGALDDKIEQNRRTARALERLARAIFRAWFVDFEPVKAKAEGATSFPSMSQKVFDALPTRFVDSEIGPVPEGWEVKALGDVSDLNARSVRKGEIKGEIEYINIASVTRGYLGEPERMDFADTPSRARRMIQDGDTIWSCVRPNRMSYLYINDPPGNRIVSTGFAVLTPIKVGPSYLYQLTTQPEFVDYLVANATGSAYPAVRSDHFEAAKFCCPSEVVLDAFEAITHPMRRWIGQAERESLKLAEMRDYLLPKMLRGSVRMEAING
ncbi:MAG: restriction endonuclease subunit S [Wenzhouxiangellaceae bacterium]